MKYIVFQHRGQFMPVIIGDHCTHSMVEMDQSTPISAGFFHYDSGKLVVEPQQADSLKMGPNARDSGLLESLLASAGTADFLCDPVTPDREEIMDNLSTLLMAEGVPSYSDDNKDGTVTVELSADLLQSKEPPEPTPTIANEEPKERIALPWLQKFSNDVSRIVRPLFVPRGEVVLRPQADGSVTMVIRPFKKRQPEPKPGDPKNETSKITHVSDDGEGEA